MGQLPGLGIRLLVSTEPLAGHQSLSLQHAEDGP